MQSLAIDGGLPVRSAPFAPWPSFSQDEIDAVVETLRSGRVNAWTGDQGRQFESEYAASVARRHAIAVANGTLALELALYALEIGPGDEVITTSRTFIASASCVVMRGAKPVFADVDPVTQNLTRDSIAAVLTSRTRAIIAVHLAGWPCDMDAILALAKEHGLKVIEDCAQAHGATYKGRPVGSFGDLAAFSFCQDKILSTGGEGGMLLTDDAQLWQKAWAYKDHGKDYAAVQLPHRPPGFRWLHESIGTNWRLTEMQAAIGRVQLTKLTAWVAARRRNAALLTRAFAAMGPLRVTVPPEEYAHSYYKYYVFVRPEHLGQGWNRDRLLQAVNAEGIPCFSGSCSEIYLEQAFSRAGLQPATRLTVARQLGETSLMFLVHPTLSDEELGQTVEAVSKVVRVAGK